MRKEDLVQDLSFLGLKYARILSNRITKEDAENLKKKYQYIHIYSFEKKDLPGFDRRVQRTPIIDLSQDLEAIFKKFNDTCKKHIRRQERNLDLTLVMLDNDVCASYKLYKRIKSQEGARPDIKKEFENCIFFNAYMKGEMIVTMSFYDNGEIIRAKHIASLRKEMAEDAKIVAQATRGLNWEVMKWGKAHGKKIFDLGGITDDPTKAGIRDFKNSFGGNDTDIYMYRYTTPVFSFLRKALNLAGKNIN
ncbi:MAG: hypothetical protein Q8R40_04915 [bacterium]|nr:hypothetical protein [bacterium]